MHTTVLEYISIVCHFHLLHLLASPYERSKCENSIRTVPSVNSIAFPLHVKLDVCKLKSLRRLDGVNSKRQLTTYIIRSMKLHSL